MYIVALVVTLAACPYLFQLDWYSTLFSVKHQSSTYARQQTLCSKYFPIKKGVNCTLLQALRLCTGRTAHKGSRGIALLFLDHGTRRGEGSASHPGRSLPQERPSTHSTGGWVGPRAGLDRCGKSRPHLDSIPETSSP